MPSKTLVGSSVATLLHQAQAAIGPDAVIVHVRRLRTKDGDLFEVTAADPRTAMSDGAVGRPATSTALELMTPAQPKQGRLVVALVGPTGAGKTTTVAKLATHPRIFGSRRVGLITLDTYRAGAVEQLRAYADIAALPFQPLYDEDEVPSLSQALGGTEVWLVDTPGRSPRQRRDRDEVDRLLKALAPTEVHLVVPAAYPEHLVRGLWREARAVAPTHLLVSKIDEAPDEASVFEAAVELDAPVRWVTDGQDVPFDLAGAGDPLAAARALASSRGGGSFPGAGR